MKISCNILKKHIKNSEDIDFLKVWDKFTIRTAEVEDVYEVGKNIDGVVVGKIISCENHPKSNKLHVLNVDVGKEVLQIVCGAPNVKEGIKVPVIQVGGHLGDIEISVRPLLGVDSHGMCCAMDELGIGDDHDGIMILPDEWEIGKDIKEYLPFMEDIIVEIDNKSLTNRPDLWGHYGIAREIAAITGHELLPLQLEDIVNNKEDINIKINTDNCLRFTGIKIGNVKNLATPLWMQVFLYYAGMRSINLLVDLTNYLMLELGQPMHAYDARNVKSIVVDMARDNTTFVTLDKEERKLTSNNMMILDGEKYIGIAGVMGGLDSETLPDTEEILLESACFDATSVRKTAISLGLRTEASARYEKSLDPNMTEIAIKRFIYLLKNIDKEIVITSNMTDVYPKKLNELEVSLSKKLLTTYMGKELDSEIVIKILTSLGFKVNEEDDSYKVIVPTFRCTKDISMAADLIEEIARMYGYENMELVPLKSDLTFKVHEDYFDKDYEIKEFLVNRYNLSEIHTYLWYKTGFLNSLKVMKDNTKLVDRTEDNILRDDIRLSLLEVCKLNMKNFNKVGIFEIGTEIHGNDNKRVLGITLVDDETSVEKVYYEAKSIVSDLFKALKNITVSFVKGNQEDYFVSDYGYDIEVNNKKYGSLNIFKPSICNEVAKKSVVIAIRIDIDLLNNTDLVDVNYQEISKYQEVNLDYTIISNKKSKYVDILNVINKYKSELIKSVKLIDVYEDNENKKYTIRYVIGSYDHTLDSCELDNFKTDFINLVKDNGLNIIE